MKAENKLSILYEDDTVVAVNKPAGLLSIPDREQSALSLKEMLKKKYGEIFTVHRLDRDTSGIIIFAKTEAAHKYYCGLFTDRKVVKIYSGIVLGEPAQESGTIQAPIAEHILHKGMMHIHRSGKPAHTDYRVLESFPQYSLVEFTLHTGRTHQIRVHAKEIGHPLACDDLYGDGKPIFISAIKKKYNLAKKEDEERPILSRLALHAHTLELETPEGKKLQLSASLPKEFTALFQQLNKYSR